MPYNIYREENKILIKSTLSIDIAIYKYAAGGGYYLYRVGAINIESSLNKTFALEDGLYKIVINEEETILSFYHTLERIVSKSFSKFLCDKCNDFIEDCGCGTLSDKAAYALKFNTLTSKVLYLETQVLKGYSQVEINNYHNFLFKGLNTLGCKIPKLFDTMIKEECIKGDADNAELYKLLITLRYLGLYFLESNNPHNISVLYTEATERGVINVVNDVFNIKTIVDCLCSTCFRFDELQTIFEEGVIVDPIIGTLNLPPSVSNFFVNIEGSGLYIKQLSSVLFANNYTDDNTNYPVSITFVTIPDDFVIENTLGEVIIAGDTINFSDINNYRLYAQLSIVNLYQDAFSYTCNDGELDSNLGKVTINVAMSINTPPNVIEGFSRSISVGSTVNISKTNLFSEGIVIDPEGDEIVEVKLEKSDIVDVYRVSPNGLDLILMAPGDTIDLTLYSSTQTIISFKLEENSNDLNIPVTLSFKDEGSNLYSNYQAVSNVMKIEINITKTIDLVFTGGYLMGSHSFRWMPLSRIAYEGDISQLSVTALSQLGGVSLPNMIIVQAVNSDLFNDVTNADSIIVPNTEYSNNVKYFDVMAFINIQENRQFSYRISAPDVPNFLTVTTDIRIEQEKEHVLKIFSLEFDAGPLSDYDILYTDYPDNFLNVVPESYTLLNTNEITQGEEIVYTSRGHKGFLIETPVPTNLKIYDSLNNDITTKAYIRFFDQVQQEEVFISKATYLPSTMFIKISLP